MLLSLHRHYKAVESHKDRELTITTFQFKDKFFFADSEARNRACKILDECTAEISDDLEEVAQSQEPLPKHPRPAILQKFLSSQELR